MSVIAKESGHWYDKDGNPAYTYLNKKGEEKNTTLRQARIDNLFPSVTTVLKIVAAPGLEIWKQNQILQAAATLPKIEGESPDDWCKRVVIDAGEHGKEARDKGTAIHGAIERYFLKQPVTEYGEEVKRVIELLDDLGITHISTEKSFSYHSGYGGKIDFIGEDKAGRPVVIDFKTQDFKGKKKKQYPEMIMQLAAYATGANLDFSRSPYEDDLGRHINIFISRNLPIPEVDFYEWEESEILTGDKKFNLALEYWQLDKGYKPTI